MGVEKVTNADLTKEENIEELRKIFPDIKESLEVGSEPAYGYPEKPYQNHFPEDRIPGVSKAIMDFYVKCDNLHKSIMSAIAVGLGLDKTHFVPQISGGDHALRFLHYPAVPKSLLTKEGAVRAGAHTDYGTITLLFQDGSGGLQARTPSGEYVDVPPIPGAIVINAGDLLQIWSNDVIKSTFHRVVSPPDAPTTDDGKFSARYSIAVRYYPVPANEVPFVLSLFLANHGYSSSLTLIMTRSWRRSRNAYRRHDRRSTSLSCRWIGWLDVCKRHIRQRFGLRTQFVSTRYREPSRGNMTVPQTKRIAVSVVAFVTFSHKPTVQDVWMREKICR
jgi:hypothetical protein